MITSHQRNCFHQRTAVMSTEKIAWVKCRVCNLEGIAVKKGRFKWWTINRAYRKFYKYAIGLDSSYDELKSIPNKDEEMNKVRLLSTISIISSLISACFATVALLKVLGFI